MPSDGSGEVEDLVGHADGVHQVAGHDEKRHGQQGRVLDPFQNMQGHGVELAAETGIDQGGQHGNADRHGDRHPEQDEPDETDKKNPGHT